MVWYESPYRWYKQSVTWSRGAPSAPMASRGRAPTRETRGTEPRAASATTPRPPSILLRHRRDPLRRRSGPSRNAPPRASQTQRTWPASGSASATPTSTRGSATSPRVLAPNYEQRPTHTTDITGPPSSSASRPIVFPASRARVLVLPSPYIFWAAGTPRSIWRDSWA